MKSQDNINCGSVKMTKHLSVPLLDLYETSNEKQCLLWNSYGYNTLRYVKTILFITHTPGGQFM